MRTFQPGRDSKPTIEVAQAQRRVLDASKPLEAELVRLGDLAGRVLAEPIFAPRDQPVCDNSAMDGYAVVSSDLAAGRSRLRLAGDLPAGSVPDRTLQPGTAARIMTGAPIPRGADAVVPVEQTEESEGFVTIARRFVAGENIRRRGEEFRSGDRLIEAATHVDAGAIATIATANLTAARVHRVPAVSIVVTGSEIAPPGTDRTEATVIDSNSPMLQSLLRKESVVVTSTERVGDDRAAIVHALRRAANSDVVISTGGVSAGAFDFVQDALVELGAEILFWKISMRPGKPVLFARRGGTLFFALPGNPASVFVAFHLFVAPALRKLAGRCDERALPPSVDAVLDGRAESKSERPVYLRARVAARDGALFASIPERQGSGMASSLSGCNALIRVEGFASKEKGERARALLIGPIP
jgi:molybdopterin molybdotransferase